jgi:hypothetical protein
VQVRAEPDNTFGVAWLTRLVDPPRIAFISDFIFSAYAPLPDPRETAFWNNNLLNVEPPWLPLVVALAVAAVGVVALLRAPLAALFHGVCTAVFLGLFYVSQLVWWRYTGHLYLVLIAGYWLARHLSAQGSAGRREALSGRIAGPFLTGILVLQAAGGITAHALDARRPFSRAPAAARYLAEHGLDRLDIVAYRDYAISPLAAHLEKPLWYPQSGRWGTFVIYDGRRRLQLDLDDLGAAVESVMRERRVEEVLLILYLPLREARDPDGWRSYDGELTRGIRVRLLAHFEGSAAGDENFYIYLARGS